MAEMRPWKAESEGPTVVEAVAEARVDARQDAVAEGQSDELKNRVLAAMIGTGPFGALIVGGLAVWWGASNAVTAIAVVGLVFAILALAIWPAFLRTSVRPGGSSAGLVGEGER